MDIRSMLTSTPPPQPLTIREASAQQHSADTSGPSAADKGKEKATSISPEKHVAAITALDNRGKKRFLASGSESAPKRRLLEANDDRHTPPAAPAQAGPSSFTPLVEKTISGWQAFTAARPASPTSPQERQASPSAPRTLPSSSQPSAQAVQAMAERQAQQASELRATGSNATTALPPLGKIENFIFFRKRNERYVITVEKKYGATGGKNGGGTTARLSTSYLIDRHGYEGALTKAREKLADFLAENEDQN